MSSVMSSDIHIARDHSLHSNTTSVDHHSNSGKDEILNRQMKWVSTGEGTEFAEGHRCKDLRQVDPNHDRRKRRRTASPKIEEESMTKEQGSDFYNLQNGNRPVHTSPSQGAVAGSPSPINPAFTGASVYYASITLDVPGQQNQQSSVNSLSSCSESPSIVHQNYSKILSSEDCAQDVEPSKHANSTARETQKFMQFNPKTGTIGSPRSIKSTIKSGEESSKKLSTGKRLKKRKSLVIKVGYGKDDSSRKILGERINQLLNLPAVTSMTPAAQPVPEIAQAVQTTNPVKQTHPFFLGKMAPKESTIPETLSVSIKTPLEVTKQVMPSAFKASSIQTPKTMGADTTERNTHPVLQVHKATSRTTKFPGAVHPIWPPRGMTHVRGDVINDASSNVHIVKHKQASGRKSKYASVEIHAEEDVLRTVTLGLDVGKMNATLKSVDTDAFIAPEQCLRLPRKHFETGKAMQRRIRGEVSSYLPSFEGVTSHDTSEDELGYSIQHQARTHPAIRKAYENIAISLTAFDQSKYETQSWVHKHSPSMALEVLQGGREPYILKDWLQALKVLSVDKGTSDGVSTQSTSMLSKRSTTAKGDQVKKKRKQTLEGFVVSDDERNDLDEISEPEADSPCGNQGLQKKTVVRVGDCIANDSKLSNTVVISGPNGCGKTAMVYAVAKELDFEVFEINSSCRRNGKDVLERVGDMTRNHLVHRGQPHDTTSAEQNSDIVTDPLAADLANGRQGTMESFFKPNIAKPKSKPTKKQAVTAGQTQRTKPPSKPQKQSLILFEEVDVLYDEDKQFWATVIALIIQSKRPIIMTCNDEALVPLQALTLHAIIRLSPPPLDLAADYLLLVAANEGHILKRNAVVSLYQASKNDLRASMTELEFWCQIGVGDRKGGLDWFYPRWPVGCDMDENGDIIRVVSEGTYKKGMGWLGRDFRREFTGQTNIEEEALREAWHGWQIDGCDTCDSLDGLSKIASANSIEHDNFARLSKYESLTETLSAADILAHGSFAVKNQVCPSYIN